MGVATRPTSITWHPTELRPAVAAPANMGPEVRASRPTTIDGRTARRPDGRFPSLAHVPNAAAHRATTSGVRSVPTRPRTPDTLTIRVSDTDDQSNGKRRRETASSEGVDQKRSYSGGGCACNRVRSLSTRNVRLWTSAPGCVVRRCWVQRVGAGRVSRALSRAINRKRRKSATDPLPHPSAMFATTDWEARTS